MEPGDAASWAALLGMSQLTALDIAWLSAAPPADMSGVAGLSALTALAVRVHGGNLPHGGLSAAEYKLLSPSLCAHLTALTLEYVTVVDATVAALATGSLVSLTAGELCLTKACHTTPLLTLKQLNVTRQLSSGAGTCLAKLAPGLADLSLRCDADVANASTFFAGLTTLETLDGSQGDLSWDQEEQEDITRAGLALQWQGLRQLAALASLKQLRLNATSNYMRCWDLFAAVPNLEWVFCNASVASTELLVDALSAGVPEHVHSLFLKFSLEKEWDYEGYSASAVQQLQAEEVVYQHNHMRIADAVFIMLARASNITSLHLSINTVELSIITDLHMCALLSVASVTRIEVVGEGLPRPLLERIRAMQASRDLQVIVRAARSSGWV